MFLIIDHINCFLSLNGKTAKMEQKITNRMIDANDISAKRFSFSY